MNKVLKEVIQSSAAPSAIGCYSPAIRVANMLYVSGQIGLHAERMELVSAEFLPQAQQALDNLVLTLEAAGASLDNVVKMTIYLINLAHFDQLNGLVEQYFTAPYPARAVVEVAALPKGAVFEVDAIAVLG